MVFCFCFIIWPFPLIFFFIMFLKCKHIYIHVRACNIELLLQRVYFSFIFYLQEEFADTKWVNRSHESMARYQRSTQKSWFNGQIPKE
jgi:hypothetical protein